MIQYLHPDYRKKMLEYDYVRIKEVDPNSLYIKLEKKLANKF